MPTETKESQLKLIHLVYGLLAAAVLVGIALGTVMNQQKVNTKEVDKKVDKEVFEQHSKQQTEQFEIIRTDIRNGFKDLKK
ncbi:unnamed protein product [marine sediment metagenome]|uniref:Uncharacterized protein n=1 Tax=marine sediment metagenome TaxID=412755 RepID=X0VF61_9ZZZZ